MVGIVSEFFNREISSSFTNNTFSSYNNITNNIDSAAKEQNSIIEKTRIPAAGLLFDYELSINFENDFLCSLKGTAQMKLQSTIQ